MKPIKNIFLVIILIFVAQSLFGGKRICSHCGKELTKAHFAPFLIPHAGVSDEFRKWRYKFLNENSDLLKEIILTPWEEEDHAKDNALNYYEDSCYEGYTKQEIYFETLLKFLKTPEYFTSSSDVVAHAKSCVFIFGYFKPLQKHYFQIEDNLSNFALCLNLMRKNDFILDDQFLESLANKALYAKVSIQENGEKGAETAIKNLNEIISAIDSQIKQKVTPMGAELIKGFAQNLIAQIQNKYQVRK